MDRRAREHVCRSRSRCLRPSASAAWEAAPPCFVRKQTKVDRAVCKIEQMDYQ